MGHCPKRKAQSAQEVQPRKTMQRIHLSPVDHDLLSHLLPSINWWSSQK